MTQKPPKKTTWKSLPLKKRRISSIFQVSANRKSSPAGPRGKNLVGKIFRTKRSEAQGESPRPTRFTFLQSHTTSVREIVDLYDQLIARAKSTNNAKLINLFTKSRDSYETDVRSSENFREPPSVE